MKVLLVSMNFAPELTGIGKYSGEMAEGLRERGHQVQVVCAPPYYPQWQVQPGHRGRAYRVDSPAPGLRVFRCPVWVPKHLGGLRRLLHLASFALSSLPVLLSRVAWRPDVVMVVAPALFCAPASWLVARLCGAPAWLHVQDLELDAAFSLGLLEGPRARRLLLPLERWLLRRFDRVSSISMGMLHRLTSKGVAPERIEYLPNGVALETIGPRPAMPEARALRQALGIAADQVVCLFSGTLNRKHGLAILPAVAERLRGHAHIVIVVSGAGEYRASLQQACAPNSNLRYLELQPQAGLNALLNMADVHLLPQLHGAADLVMPSKLAGMLASGRPVVAAAHAGSEMALQVHGRGIAVEPESVDALAAAIIKLAADAGLRVRLGQAARAHAEARLDAATIFDTMHRSLQSLVQPAFPAAAQARPSAELDELSPRAPGGANGHAGPPVSTANSTPNSPPAEPQRPMQYARARRGFTLLELLVVMVIIGLLAAYVGPKYFSQVGKSELKSVRAQIVGLEKALEQYRIDVGRYPSTEQGLAALLTRPADTARWSGPYLGKALPPDPWGQAYQYRAPGTQGEVDVYSFGRDGRPGGAGDDADVGNW